MVEVDRHILRLSMVLCILVGMALLMPGDILVSSAAMRQTIQPRVGDFPVYLPLVNRSDFAPCYEITTDATWGPAGSILPISCDIYVAPGAILTIDAGVTIVFMHPEDDLIIAGRLQAVGTEQAPIIFKQGSSVTRGSWGSVAFWPGSSGLLDHTFLDNGGHNKGMVYIASDSVQVINSVIQNSLKSGIYIQAASPWISDNQILINEGYYGGGIYNDVGSPLIQNNTFGGNSASPGGGLYNGSGNPVIQNNTFTGNAAGQGGGLYNEYGSPTIQGNQFIGNFSYTYGGGLYINSGNPTIQNNTFTGNSLPSENTDDVFGAGVYNGFGNPLIQDNIFTNNSVSCEAAPLYNDLGPPLLLYPPFPTISWGGGLYNDSGSPTIENNIFTDNRVCWGGGLVNSSGSPLIQNNTFTYNDAPLGGGGLVNSSGSPLIQNNTFTGNSAALGGGGLLANGNPTIRNNIIAWNAQWFDVLPSGTPIMDFNDVWNNHGGDYSGIIPGPHDISADPAWVDPANGDFHLSSGSPGIDAGDPVNFPATDIDGDSRPIGLASDIGVDEYCGLQLALAALQEEIPPGKPVIYRMILGNYTTISLTNVLLTDTLPAETAYTSYQADGLTCIHDGSTWGGQLSCSLDSLSLAPGESRIMTVTVLLSQTLPLHQYVTNHVLATANGGGRTFIAEDQAISWVTWCSIQLNSKPMGNNLQVAIDASTQITDVIQVTDYCHVHDLRLNKTLTLQGGWSHDFNEWDPAVYTTTLDGQSLGRVIWVDGVVSPTIEGFMITGGYTNGSGGGTLISSGSPTIQNNIFTGNTAIWGGGGLYNLSGNPTIQNNTFSDNFGIGLYNGSGNPTIQNNTFSNNSGGGVVNDSGSPLVQNNTFFENGGVLEGGGLYNGSGNPVIENNIFSENSAWGSGGGLYNGSGNPVIRNNIVVSNSSGGGIYNSSGAPILDYNDVWNNTGGDYSGVVPGAHDISVDPLLVDPIGGDFHLSAGSPCIDAGDPLNYPPTDFEGDPRPQRLAPDIGADEYRSTSAK